MGLKLEYIDGQTPLNEEEKDGLLMKTITTRGELDELEQLNIEKTIEWILNNKFARNKILTEEFIKIVHKKCLEMCGSGLELLENLKKTLVFVGL